MNMEFLGNIREVPVGQIRKSLEETDLSPKSKDPEMKRFNIYYTSLFKEEVQKLMDEKNIKSEGQFWIEAGIAFLLGYSVERLQDIRQKLITDIGDIETRATELEQREQSVSKFEDQLLKDKERVKAREKTLSEKEIAQAERLARREKELEGDYKSKNSKLEQAYQEKDQDLDKRYQLRHEKLEDDYKLLGNELKEKYQNLVKQQDEDHQRRMDELEKKESLRVQEHDRAIKELAEKKAGMEKELMETRTEISKYVEVEFLDREKQLDKKDIDLTVREKVLEEREKFWDTMFTKVQQLISTTEKK